jgi:oxygen-independent coproporphyrinogen-3 oxidase
MTPHQISDILKVIRDLWTVDNKVEIAIEANPNDADKDRWLALSGAGINRMSLGVQSFHNPALKLLGRYHDKESARSATDLAVSIFPSVSMDLIFGWAGQTPDQWQSDLDIALESQVTHLSAYQLTIEQGTAFAKAAERGEIKRVNDDLSADLYARATTSMTKAGFDHYEVSNFARPRHKSRHNLTYWQGGDYAGIGPGAHGRLTRNERRYATIASARPAHYVQRVNETNCGICETETLSSQDWGNEYVLMGLRISSGISLSRYHRITGQNLDEQPMSELIDNGLVQRHGDSLWATPKGCTLLDYVTQTLLGA